VIDSDQGHQLSPQKNLPTSSNLNFQYRSSDGHKDVDQENPPSVGRDDGDDFGMAELVLAANGQNSVELDAVLEPFVPSQILH